MLQERRFLAISPSFGCTAIQKLAKLATRGPRNDATLQKHPFLTTHAIPSGATLGSTFEMMHLNTGFAFNNMHSSTNLAFEMMHVIL